MAGPNRTGEARKQQARGKNRLKKKKKKKKKEEEKKRRKRKTTWHGVDLKDLLLQCHCNKDSSVSLPEGQLQNAIRHWNSGMLNVV